MFKRVLAIAIIGAAALTSVGACASDYRGPGTWDNGLSIRAAARSSVRVPATLCSAALLPRVSVGTGVSMGAAVRLLPARLSRLPP